LAASLLSSFSSAAPPLPAKKLGGGKIPPFLAIAAAILGIGGVGADEELYKVDESLQSKEHLNAQVAMAGVFLTILLDLISGQP
jgi:hypothetical protein